MNITMLGSGCWEGTPAPFCSCKICTIASRDHNSVEYRSRPEFLVSTQTGKFLIEISPDIRTQSTRHELPAITDFVVSHWHFDHMFGLYELHAWIELVLKSKINIYCSEAARQMLDKQFGYIPTNIKTLHAYQSFELKGTRITPIPMYHMKHTDQGKSPEELENTFGFIVEADGKKVSYLADYYSIPKRSMDLIKGSDVVVADGTYLFQELYPDKPYQNATHEEEDPDHIHGNDILKFTSTSEAKRVVYHSITHLPEKEHHELQALLPEGHEVGFDGMKVL